KSFGLNKCFDEGVPLLDEGTELVFSDSHTVEVGVAIVALDFFNLYLHFSPGLIIAISIQISQRYFEDTSFQTISGDLYTRRNDERGRKLYFDQQSCCKE